MDITKINIISHIHIHIKRTLVTSLWIRLMNLNI